MKYILFIIVSVFILGCGPQLKEGNVTSKHYVEGYNRVYISKTKNALNEIVEKTRREKKEEEYWIRYCSDKRCDNVYNMPKEVFDKLKVGSYFNYAEYKGGLNDKTKTD